MNQKQYDKLVDWIANEVSLAMAGAYFRGGLNMEIFPSDKRPDYECASKIIKKLGVMPPTP